MLIKISEKEAQYLTDLLKYQVKLAELKGKPHLYQTILIQKIWAARKRAEAKEELYDE